MEQKFLSFRGSTVSYLRFGKGPEIVLCFHGYGDSGNSFSFLETGGGEKFTFLAIDLPFHGKTDWKKSEVPGPADLKTLVDELLFHNGLFRDGKDHLVTLLGFSLGGRVALSLYQMMPGRVKKIILLAPDGLKVNFWYWLSTQTWAGNRLFYLTMNYPGWFFGMLNILRRLRLIDNSVFKFIHHYLDKKEARSLLYLRWTCLRKIKPDLKKIKSVARENGTPLTLVYGKYDRIILPGGGKKFMKGTENLSSLMMLDAGHQLLHKNHSGEIISWLSHP